MEVPRRQGARVAQRRADLCLVTRFAGAGRHHGRAVMLRHRLVGPLDLRVVPARARDTRLELVRDQGRGAVVLAPP